MRKPPIILASLLALVAVTLGGIVLALPFATGIAGWAAERRLAALMGAPAEVVVTDIGWGGAAIASVRVGDRLRLDGLGLRWRPLGLLAGRVDEVSIGSGLVRGVGGGVGGGAGGGAPEWSVGRIHLAQAVLDLPLPWGRRALPLSLDYDDASGSGRIAVAGMGTATLRREGETLWLDATEPWTMDLGGGRTVSLGGMAGQPLHLALRHHGGGYVLAGAAAAEVTLPEADGVTILADGTVGLDGDPYFQLRRLTVDARKLRTTHAVLDATLDLAELGGMARQASAKATLRATAHDVDAGDMSLTTTELELGGRLALDGRRLTVTLDQPGRIATRGGSLDQLVEVSAPAALTILPGASLDAALTEHGLTLKPVATVAGELPLRIGDVDVVATIPKGDVDGDLAWPDGPTLPNVRVSGATLDFPQWAWRAGAVEASIAPSPTGPAIHVASSPVGPAAGDAVLTAVAELLPVEDGLRLTARLSGPAVDIRVDGYHDSATGRGSATLASPPIRFAPDGLQPRQLVPGLAGISEASGTASIAGTASWSNAGFTPDMRLALEEFGGRLGHLVVHKVGANLRLNRVSPLSSPPDQRVTVRRIEGALPLTDARMSFRLDRGRLVIAHAAARLADGIVTTRNAVLNPKEQGQRLVLDVTEVDLARLIELIELDGLSGSGRLSGTIPLVLTGDDVAIENARLESMAPGQLRYQPADPSRVTAMGESMALLMKALDDFRYTKLSMTLHGKAGGDLLAGMTVNGANPSLYNGYPIELNLNVSGKLGSIIDDVRITDELPDILRQPAP